MKSCQQRAETPLWSPCCGVHQGHSASAAVTAVVAMCTADHALLRVCLVGLLVKTWAPLRDLLTKTGASAQQTPI